MAGDRAAAARRRRRDLAELRGWCNRWRRSAPAVPQQELEYDLEPVVGITVWNGWVTWPEDDPWNWIEACDAN
jgi:hypothetical protein